MTSVHTLCTTCGEGKNGVSVGDSDLMPCVMQINAARCRLSISVKITGRLPA